MKVTPDTPQTRQEKLAEIARLFAARFGFGPADMRADPDPLMHEMADALEAATARLEAAGGAR